MESVWYAVTNAWTNCPCKYVRTSDGILYDPLSSARSEIQTGCYTSANCVLLVNIGPVEDSVIWLGGCICVSWFAVSLVSCLGCILCTDYYVCSSYAVNNPT